MSDEGFAKRPLLRLIADLPRLVIGQVKNEIEQFKQEMIGKLKHAGIGIGLFAAAGFLGFFLFAILLTAAILGFATVVPGWLAALIVAGFLLLLITVLVIAGVRHVKQGIPPAPTETITSVKKDLNAIRGIGQRGNA